MTIESSSWEEVGLDLIWIIIFIISKRLFYLWGSLAKTMVRLIANINKSDLCLHNRVHW